MNLTEHAILECGRRPNTSILLVAMLATGFRETFNCKFVSKELSKLQERSSKMIV